MNCYLCGSAEVAKTRETVRDRRINVWLCRDCGLDFLEQPGRDLEQFYAGEYREEYSPSVQEAADSRAIYEQYLPLQQERIDRLRPYLPAGGRLLDIGCSAGHFLRAASPFVGEACGIELNRSNCAFVNEQLGFEVHSVPLQSTGWPQAHFDMITVFHTLEHIADPREFLIGIAPYLSPGGVLYVEVPSVDDALLGIYGISEFADFWYREPHLFNFSPRTLPLLMQQAGFDGQLLPVQRYSLLNHLQWKLTRAPQESATTAMSVPDLVGGETPVNGAARVLNDWFAGIDAQYRALLGELGASESIGFVGRRQADAAAAGAD